MSTDQNMPETCPVPHGRFLLPKSSPTTETTQTTTTSTSSTSSNEPPDTPDHVCPHAQAKVIRKYSSAYDSDTNTVATTTTTTTTTTTAYDTIPEGEIPSTGRGNSENGQSWLNPSPNQLYHALSRRNKPIEYDDALNVARIHQMVTGQTWDAILEYESLHFRQCPTPKLAKFEGKDGIYSPKAKFFNKWLGLPLPYDRHDWVVDRCGQEITYIIDYYAVPVPISELPSSLEPPSLTVNSSSPSTTTATTTTNESTQGNQHQPLDSNTNLNQTSTTQPKSPHYEEFVEDKNVDFVYSIDARPKLNRFGNAWDRIRVAYRHWKNGENWF